MRLEDFIYYAEVYHLNSINKAGQKLNISQQRLSAIIKQIEREFDTTFFTRSKTGIFPTPEGDIFYQYVKKVMQETIMVKNKLTSTTIVNKTCRIGTSSVFSKLYGKSFYNLLTNIAPDIFFDIKTIPFLSVVPSNIYNYDIIVAGCSFDFLENFFKHECSNDYFINQLCELQLSVWMSKQSPLVSKKKISEKVLKSQNYCQLKNISNSEDAQKFLNFLNTDINASQIYIAETMNVMIDLVERFNFIVSDVSFPNKRSLYQDIFSDTNAICKDIQTSEALCFIAKKEQWDFLYPLISNLVFCVE